MVLTAASGSLALNPPAIHRDLEDAERLTFRGSGGHGDVFFCKPSGSALEVVVLHPSGQDFPQLETAAPAIAEIQDTICAAFSLTMSDLAFICHTTRKTLYNWREGIPPRPSAAHRLFTLYRAARDWRQAGYPAPGSRLREPILGDRSLYDVLYGEPIDLDAIDFIGSDLAMEATPKSPLKDPFP